MNIALVGTGQTGSAVVEQAKAQGHNIVAAFNSKNPLPVSQNRKEALGDVEVVIDFSLPDVVLDHIEAYCRWQVPAVIGTTGWYEDLPTVKEWVEQHQASLLYAANFSLGVALVVRALRGALPLLDQLDEYDAFVHEVHHTNKVDSPSGTARMLGGELLDGLQRKEELEVETQHGRIAPEQLHVSSTRAGTVFGQHTVGLDSAFDQVRIEHDAKNRKGFAAGALRAASWLRRRQGLYTLDDVLADMERSS